MLLIWRQISATKIQFCLINVKSNVFLSVLLIHCRSQFFLLTFCQQLIYEREKQADKMKNYAINDITSLDGMHVYLMVYLL